LVGAVNLIEEQTTRPSEERILKIQKLQSNFGKRHLALQNNIGY
jgi:hypothetical protein